MQPGRVGPCRLDPRLAHRNPTDSTCSCRRGCVLSWIWSESTLWNSTREYGYHEICLVFGLIVTLQSLRIVQRLRNEESDRFADWAILGGAAGLGFWASPEVVYFAIPALVIVASTLRTTCSAMLAAKRLAVAVGAAFLCIVPWIWAVSTSSSGLEIPSSAVSYLSRLGTFFTHVLPMILGLRVEGVGVWEGGEISVWSPIHFFSCSCWPDRFFSLGDGRMLGFCS